MNPPASILIVDDEPFVPRVVGLKLTQAGYRTLTTRDATEALGIIERERPQVVITDISMPGMSGYDLCVRSQPLRADHPFLLIVVTSRTERDLRNWVREIPDLHFFEKPVSPRVILRTVQEYLARGQSPATPAEPAAVLPEEV